MGDVHLTGEPDQRTPANRRDQPLRRSRMDRIFFGVCGGLGRYLDVDPTVIRTFTVVLVLAGVGIPAYLVTLLVIPDADAESIPSWNPARRRRATLVSVGLLGLGVFLLSRGFTPWFHTSLFWPLLATAGGALLVATARR